MTDAAFPRVAVVGYPNVGKSTLFNRLTGTREAVVAPEAGVTRDRKEGRGEWRTREFVVVDTGGIDLQAAEPLAEQVRDQARQAITEASAVIFLVDGRNGVGPQEHEIADLLRRSAVPVVLAVNKIDAKAAEQRVAEFWELGLGEPYGISAEHGMGTGDLLDAVVEALPAAEELPLVQASAKVAIVGRPNVGKSSLVNALLGGDRVIVSPIPGTTRDAIDTPLTIDGRTVTLVDTAGLRRSGRRTTTDVEYYSGLRALKAMERSDVALVVVDASEGVVDLDLQVAYEAQRANCATAVLFNKWDVADEFDLDLARERLYAKVQMRPPSVTVSAKTGRSLDRVLPLALSLYDRYRSRIPTAELNRWLEEMRKRPAPQRRGKMLKLFYMVQYDDSPPRFKIMVNARALLSRGYVFFLENRLREAYNLWGIPLIIDFEGKEERFS